MKLALSILISFATFFTFPTAFAGLGGDQNSIAKDTQNLSGQQKTGPTTPLFTVQEIDTDVQKIKEYLTLNGTVFAITWHGVSAPDLGPLLGSYSNETQSPNKEASSTKKKMRRQKRVTHSDHVVIEKFGHMGDVRGKAYIPQLIPVGVTAEDIVE